MIKMYSPASIGNVGVGFDVLGMAITPIDRNVLLGDEITIESSKTFNLSIEGQFANQLPNNPKKNIVFQCWNSFCHKIKKIIPMSITLKKNMPISSGLGSSACSIVASIVGINEFCNQPFKEIELIRLMGKLEEKISGSIHYDNVVPCYLGGLQIILAQKDILCQSIPYFKNWLWVISWPGIKVSTSSSRNVLPKIYTKNACIQHSRSLAGFIHASYTNQSNLAAKLMHDIIAEPYRVKLLPKFLEAKKATKKLGAIGFGISGSGPTVFAICEDLKTAKKLLTWFNKHYLQTTEGFTHICHVDSVGTKKVQ